MLGLVVGMLVRWGGVAREGNFWENDRGSHSWCMGFYRIFTYFHSFNIHYLIFHLVLISHMNFEPAFIVR